MEAAKDIENYLALFLISQKEKDAFFCLATCVRVHGIRPDRVSSNPEFRPSAMPAGTGRIWLFHVPHQPRNRLRSIEPEWDVRRSFPKEVCQRNPRLWQRFVHISSDLPAQETPDCGIRPGLAAVLRRRRSCGFSARYPRRSGGHSWRHRLREAGPAQTRGRNRD